MRARLWLALHDLADWFGLPERWVLFCLGRAGAATAWGGGARCGEERPF